MYGKWKMIGFCYLLYNYNFHNYDTTAIWQVSPVTTTTNLL